jgi:hypothetical protein
MGHQNPVQDGCSVQYLWIADPPNSSVSGWREIDGGLLFPYGLNDVEIEIGVGLEANAQEWDSPIFALARWIFSQRAGSACFMGIPLASNSRSVSSRYLSISAL